MSEYENVVDEWMCPCCGEWIQKIQLRRPYVRKDYKMVKGSYIWVEKGEDNAHIHTYIMYSFI